MSTRTGTISALCVSYISPTLVRSWKVHLSEPNKRVIKKKKKKTKKKEEEEQKINSNNSNNKTLKR